MAAVEEEAAHFVDRRESMIESPLPSQISPQKVVIRDGGSSVDSVLTTTAVRELSFTEAQRSEVRVEVEGYRETAFLSSEKMVTDTVRTVYGRSLSGSTSSQESDHKEAAHDREQIGEDSAFSDVTYVAGAAEERERTASDSYYISHTYQMDALKSPSRSVTALNYVTFKSSTHLDLGAHGFQPDESSLYFIDRAEEMLPAESPYVLGSPRDKNSPFEWSAVDEDDLRALEKLRSAREDVQHLIENTYRVNDIADVIDDKPLLYEASKPTAETSVGSEAQQNVSSTEASRACSYASFKAQSDLGGDTAWLSANPTEVPTAVDSDQDLESDPTPNRESPPRLDYSPGVAIRSFALEELTEKKSRSTPERMEETAKSMRYDTESSAVDIDKGSSVDAVSGPHLQRQEFTHAEQTHVSSNTKDTRMFTLTKVQKVILPDDPYLNSNFQIGDVADAGYPLQEMTKEEEDESLDKLVDLHSIQIGYKFHDVGIMQGGFCNLAFDDSDESDARQLTDYDKQTCSFFAQGQTRTEVSARETSQLQSTGLSSHVQSDTFKGGSVYTEGQTGVDQASCFLPESADSLCSINGSTQDGASGLYDVRYSSLSTTQNIASAISSCSMSQDTELSGNSYQKDESETEASTQLLSGSSKDESVSVESSEAEAGEEPRYSHGYRETDRSEDRLGSDDFQVTTDALPKKATSITLSEHIQQSAGITMANQELRQSKDDVDARIRLSGDYSGIADSEITTRGESQSYTSAVDYLQHQLRDADSGATWQQYLSFAEDMALMEATTIKTVDIRSGQLRYDSPSTEDTVPTPAEADVGEEQEYSRQDGETDKAEDTMVLAEAGVGEEQRYSRHAGETDRAENTWVLTEADVREEQDYSRQVDETDRAEDIRVSTETEAAANALAGKEGTVIVSEHLARTTELRRSEQVLRQVVDTSRTVESEVVTDFKDQDKSYPTSAGQDNIYNLITHSSEQGVLEVEAMTVSTEQPRRGGDSTAEWRDSQQISACKDAKRGERQAQAVSVATAERGHVDLTSTILGSANAQVLQTERLQERRLLLEADKIRLAKNESREMRPPVQVTRRFNVSRKFEAALKSRGATLKSETMTIDVYYDTRDFDLTLSDCWLRSRNGKWQLHCNFTKLLNDATKTLYSEEEDKDHILPVLSNILQRPLPDDPDTCLAAFIQKSGLRDFVRYTTTRKTYVYMGLTIDLELPEYGFWVGSVTALAQIHEAVNSIDMFWQATGVEALNLLLA